MHPQDTPFSDPLAGRLDSSMLESGGQAHSSGPDIKSLLQGLKRRWMLAVTLGGTLALLAALAAWLLLSPDYTAFAQVRVSYLEPRLTANKTTDNVSFKTFIRSQAALLQSRPVIQAALRRDDVKALRLETKYPDPAVYLEDKLKVEFEEDSEFITVTMAAPEEHEAITVVKAITESYMDYIGYREANGRTQRITELEKVKNETSANLKTKKANLRRLAKTLGTLDRETLERQRDDILSNVRDLRLQRLPLVRERDRAIINLKVLQSQGKPTPPTPETSKGATGDEAGPEIEKPTVTDNEVEEVLERDAIARPFLVRYQAADAKVEDYDRNAVDPLNEPVRIQAARERSRMKSKLDERRAELREIILAKKQEAIDRELERLQQPQPTPGQTTDPIRQYEYVEATLLNTIQTLKQQIDGLDDEINLEREALAALQGATGDTEMLQNEIARDERILDDLDRTLKDAQLNSRAPDRITLHQEADMQKKDVRKQLLATIAAGMLVFLSVCFVVSYQESRQQRVLSANELNTGLGLRVVGSVPRVAHLEHHLVDATGEFELEGHPVMESIDALRTFLMHGTERIVMVSSAHTGEGKTTLAGHLASSLARAGRKTLLIDGDLRTPLVHELFELPMQPGFSEVLLAEIDTHDACHESLQENLFVMPAGQWDREVLQALARDGLEGVFDRLRQEFDYIIVDSHPVLAANDALLLGQQVDGVLLSVMRNVSQRPRIQGAALRLSSLNIHVLGAVVNGTDPEEILSGSVVQPQPQHQLPVAG